MVSGVWREVSKKGKKGDTVKALCDGKWRTVKIVDVCEYLDQFMVQYGADFRTVCVNGADLREIRERMMPFDGRAVKVGDYVQWTDDTGYKYKEDGKEPISKENPRLEHDHSVFRIGRVQQLISIPYYNHIAGKWDQRDVMEVIYHPRPSTVNGERWRLKTRIAIDQMRETQSNCRVDPRKIFLETKELPLEFARRHLKLITSDEAQEIMDGCAFYDHSITETQEELMLLRKAMEYVHQENREREFADLYPKHAALLRIDEEHKMSEDEVDPTQVQVGRRLALGDTTPSTVGIVSGIIALTGLLGFYLYRRFSRKRTPKTDVEAQH